MGICVISICVVFVSENLRQRVIFREFGNQAGNFLTIYMYTDMLIRIKNATSAGKKTVRVRHTLMDHAISEVLLRYGFLKKIEVKGRAPKRTLEFVLSAERPVEHVRFLSTPSLRRYAGYKDFRAVKGGRGILVVSTPKGVKSGLEAFREKVGGQLLCEVW